MYGDERPHDKTVKVNTFYFSFPAHVALSLTLSVFGVNPACVSVSARECVCPRVRAPACGFTASQISLNARCCKAAAQCNLTLTL